MNLEKPPVSPPVSIPPPVSNNNGYLPSQSFGQAPSTVSDSLITYNHITYALAILAYFTAGLTWIVPIFMNYLNVMRREVLGCIAILTGKLRPFGTVYFSVRLLSL